jgi:hypothetical protein
MVAVRGLPGAVGESVAKVGQYRSAGGSALADAESGVHDPAGRRQAFGLATVRRLGGAAIAAGREVTERRGPGGQECQFGLQGIGDRGAAREDGTGIQLHEGGIPQHQQLQVVLDGLAVVVVRGVEVEPVPAPGDDGVPRHSGMTESGAGGRSADPA